MIGIAAATNFIYMATACLAYLSSGVKYGDAQLVMPVDFPDDATLTEMTIHAIDNVNLTHMIAYLMKVPKTGVRTSETSIADVSTEFLPLSVNVQAVSKSINLPVENANSYYYLLIDINSSGSQWGNVGLALRSITFKYQISY
jgi:hypothetical protein